MLPRIFSEIFGGVWLMDKTTADAYMPLVISILKGDFQKNGIDFSEARQKNNLRYVSENQFGVYSISDYGAAAPPEEAPKNSIAIMNITDAITKYDMECGPSGMKTKSNILERIYNTNNIKGVMLNIDSGGGEGSAMRLFADTLRKRNKNVIAFVDDFAASAAYGIASATDWVVANNKLAKVGSIGTYMTIADYEKAYEKAGIRLIEVYAEQSTDKNKEYYDALKGDLSGIRAMATRYNEEFLQMVTDNRGAKLKNSSWNTGKLFDADKALEIGLIDEIDSFENTIYSFANSLNLS